jgi:hypothetical protein
MKDNDHNASQFEYYPVARIETMRANLSAFSGCLDAAKHDYLSE